MTLNEVMKDTADAIREKTGKSELIKPVDFATEIKGITAGGSGSSELEGEYFLAKPNGRYWKSKLARIERGKYPAIMSTLDTFTPEQFESVLMCYKLISSVGFSGIGDYGGIPTHGTEISYFGSLLYERIQNDMTQFLYNPTFISLLGAWQEGSMIIQNNADSSIIFNGIVDIIRSLIETDGMSDDEILAMVSEMCMMEQVTKEEYESWYKW